MKVESVTLEKKYHDAVEHWRRHYLKDYDSLIESWDKYFPQDEPFCLCAKMEIGTPENISVGEHAGEKKRARARSVERGGGEAPARHHPRAGLDRIRLDPAARRHAGACAGRRGPLLGAARHGGGAAPRLPDVPPAAVAGLERGLGRCHRARRWSRRSCPCRPASHVLDAFNVEYDSFMDNIMFAAFIDRVGKYQLTMQKVCAYKPMADSMPPMLREEAFHLAAGVIPMRRWAQPRRRGRSAGHHVDDPASPSTSGSRAHSRCSATSAAATATSAVRLQGPEESRGAGPVHRGSAAHVARHQLALPARPLPRRTRPRRSSRRSTSWSARAACTAAWRSTNLLRVPDRRFFRRKGEPAFAMVGVDGETFEDAERVPALPGASPATRATWRVATCATTPTSLRLVAAGELSVKDAHHEDAEAQARRRHLPVLAARCAG